ncbi:30S ribosome-binding factor RbfA [Paraliomyxa miuraensis]|uniref:30S ribosome-binding factor RbfA n=1 Tax=Paraliomyxa miuraensis TaxID=376150 RepID=UPI002253907E|nr:30S ribosome-binding factor RbfA [Paraliomyxa miuraensis]MCX4244628.1 30S ribosome-binding factor RbfA [Paraliomyxa miuraensis]
MSTRLSRVEETLRRALAEIIVRGDLRDPRLSNAAAISITAAKISPDLGSAVVYVDVLGEQGSAVQRVIEGLNAGASAIRAKLGGRIRLKRTPSLRFVVDRSIEHGRKIEAVLAQIHAEAATNGPTNRGTAELDDDDEHEAASTEPTS